MDLYKVLGVERDAHPAEIKDAYRRLSSIHHPDREGGDEARMASVNAAYEVLSDEQRRRDYDAGITDAGMVEANARDFLLMGFEMELGRQGSSSGAQLIATMRIGIHDQMRQCRDAQQGVACEIASFKQMLHRVRRKRDAPQGMDLYKIVLDRKLSSAERHQVELRGRSEVLATALKMLEDYEVDGGIVGSGFTETQIAGGARVFISASARRG